MKKTSEMVRDFNWNLIKNSDCRFDGVKIRSSSLELKSYFKGWCPQYKWSGLSIWQQFHLLFSHAWLTERVAIWRAWCLIKCWRRPQWKTWNADIKWLTKKLLTFSTATLTVNAGNHHCDDIALISSTALAVFSYLQVWLHWMNGV